MPTTPLRVLSRLPALLGDRLRSALEARTGAAWLALLAALLIGAATRLALLATSATEAAWDASLAAAFALGAVFDLAAALWWAAPLAVVLAFLPAGFLKSRWCRAAMHPASLVLLYLLCFGAVAEWFFWEEFGVRFNFIAVDYLVYTKEVIGNIRESYPMPTLYTCVFMASIGLHLLLVRLGWLRRWLDAAPLQSGPRWRTAAGWMAAMLAVGLLLREDRLPSFQNNYNRELAKNGLWSLFAAFRANELDYERFYPTMPIDAAFARVRELLARDASIPLTTDPHDLLRLVGNEGPERRLNVIQITVESLSADFLGAYNPSSHLTPNLDAIARKSLVFEHCYATGTRTDRGMEALTLSVPPTAGRSLIKRPANEHLFSLGSVLRSRGYETAFIYGGFGYFDNMNYFFGENGYRVVDRTSVASGDITFSNIWGACDEDLYRWTLREADKDHASGKPFHYFVMTTSNHRPYTFPAGRIDLPSKVSGREGAVKYTDYAIGAFLRAAESKPWFRDTLFVIVADHCAASAGKTDLPVQNYRIPLIVYAPGGHIPPGTVQPLMSQIDFAPTLLGLLGWTYPSRFYGHNVLNTHDHLPGLALLGNYQKLAQFRGDRLHILQPVRKARSLTYDPASHGMRARSPDSDEVNDTIALYQTASWLFKNGRQRELAPSEAARLIAKSAATSTEHASSAVLSGHGGTGAP